MKKEKVGGGGGKRLIKINGNTGQFIVHHSPSTSRSSSPTDPPLSLHTVRRVPVGDPGLFRSFLNPF